MCGHYVKDQSKIKRQQISHLDRDTYFILDI
jgi:hypothetical protein